MANKHIVYWHHNDYRLQDNDVFRLIDDNVNSFTPIAFMPDEEIELNRYGLRDIGSHRKLAIKQGIEQLQRRYQTLGSRLFIFKDRVELVLSAILKNATVTHLVRTRQVGCYEQVAWNKLKTQFPHIQFIEVDNHSLLTYQQAMVLSSQWPMSFSQFRKRIAQFDFRPLTNTPIGLPAAQNIALYVTENQNANHNNKQEHFQALTGNKKPLNEERGIQHINWYFSTDLPHSYKRTRNELFTEQNATRFSIYLALGLVSVTRIVSELTLFESRTTASESSQWILFELLWREYFYWLSQHYSARLFYLSGIANKKPLLTFHADSYQAWCQGNTPWSLVNACMTELNQTGYLSNRGRQIVASCFVNELRLDWRYGAAYFQQQLIDYEVGSNWGNWQYIAGVGTDPKGGRHFNIVKQTELYDGNSTYRYYWLGDNYHNVSSATNQRDFNGWPVGD